MEITEMHHRVLAYSFDGPALPDLPEAHTWAVDKAGATYDLYPAVDDVRAVRQATRELAAAGLVSVWQEDSRFDGADALAAIDDPENWERTPGRWPIEIWNTPAGQEAFNANYTRFGGEERSRKWREALNLPDPTDTPD